MSATGAYRLPHLPACRVFEHAGLGRGVVSERRERHVTDTFTGERGASTDGTIRSGVLWFSLRAAKARMRPFVQW